MPGLADLLPTPGGRVMLRTAGGGPSRLSPWSNAAVSWLTTALGPRAAEAAAAETSKGAAARKAGRAVADRAA